MIRVNKICRVKFPQMIVKYHLIPKIKQSYPNNDQRFSKLLLNVDKDLFYRCPIIVFLIKFYFFYALEKFVLSGPNKKNKNLFSDTDYSVLFTIRKPYSVICLVGK